MANMYQQLNSIDMLLFAGKNIYWTQTRPCAIPIGIYTKTPYLCPHIKISYFLLYDLLEINLLELVNDLVIAIIFAS